MKWVLLALVLLAACSAPVEVENTMVEEPVQDVEPEEVVPEQEIAEVEEELVEERVLTGQFVDSDVHEGTGTAEIKGETLYLTDFKTDWGPDLKVYLSTDKEATEFVDLGELQSKEGDQEYELPPGTNPEDYVYVLVWCRAFSVLFTSAELA